MEVGRGDLGIHFRRYSRPIAGGKSLDGGTPSVYGTEWR